MFRLLAAVGQAEQTSYSSGPKKLPFRLRCTIVVWLIVFYCTREKRSDYDSTITESYHNYVITSVLRS